MLSYVIVALVFFAAGLVVGGAIVRNNIKKVNATVSAVQKTAADVSQVASAVGAVASDVKKV